MDKKLLGNFTSYFQTIVYIAYRVVVTRVENSGINWRSIFIATLIGGISHIIDIRIKNNGDVI